MDISSAIVAKSDQINSVDLTGGPQTVTVVEVTKGSADQPVNIITDVFGPARPFKPSKTVLRILANAWGKETNDWAGHSMTIYRDPAVRWAGEEVGGIRISALSHIDKAFTMNLPTSKGKHSKSTVTPLAAPVQRDWLAEMADAGNDADALYALGTAAKAAGASEQIRDTIRDAWNKAKEDAQ
jgi:hypothetical protein